VKQADESIQVKALSYAYRLLSYRPRTCKELSLRLEQKGYLAETIRDIIELLTEKRYLDDVAFARFWVNSRLAVKPIGKKLLILELRKKGVKLSVIEQVLDQFEDEYNELELARSLAEKRLEILRKNPKLEEKTIMKRLYDYLGRRGFSYEIIKEVT